MTRCFSVCLITVPETNLVAIGFHGGGLGGLLALKGFQGGGKVIHGLQMIGQRCSLGGRGGHNGRLAPVSLTVSGAETSATAGAGSASAAASTTGTAST